MEIMRHVRQHIVKCRIAHVYGDSKWRELLRKAGMVREGVIKEMEKDVEANEGHPWRSSI